MKRRLNCKPAEISLQRKSSRKRVYPCLVDLQSKQNSTKPYLLGRSPFRKFYYCKSARGKWHRVHRVLGGMRLNYYMYHGKNTPRFRNADLPRMPPVVSGMMRHHRSGKGWKFIPQATALESVRTPETRVKGRRSRGTVPEWRMATVIPISAHPAFRSRTEKTERTQNIIPATIRFDTAKPVSVKPVRSEKVERINTAEKTKRVSVTAVKQPVVEKIREQITRTTVSRPQFPDQRIPRQKPVSMKARRERMHEIKSKTERTENKTSRRSTPVLMFTRIEKATRTRIRNDAHKTESSRVAHRTEQRISRRSRVESKTGQRIVKLKLVSVNGEVSSVKTIPPPKTEKTGREVGYYRHPKRRFMQLKTAVGAESLPE